MLMTELSEEFTRDEIVVHTADIRHYVLYLREQGKLRDQSPLITSSDKGTTAMARRDPGARSSNLETRSTSREGNPSLMITSTHNAVSEAGSDKRAGLVRETGFAAVVGANNHPDTPQPLKNSGSFEPSDSSRSKSSAPNRRIVNTIEDLFPSLHSSIDQTRSRYYVGLEISVGHCRVAAYDMDLKDAYVLVNDHGNLTTPTCIAFTPTDILIGEDAKGQAAENITNTFSGFTLLLGAYFDDEVTQRLLLNSSFHISNHHGYPAFFAPCRNRHYTPVQLTALIIKKMVFIAEKNLNQRISKIHVSTRPAMGWLGTEALHRAAAKANVQIPKFIPHCTTMATLKWLIDNDRLEDSGKLVLAIDIRSDSCDFVLIGTKDEGIRQDDIVSHNFGSAVVGKHLTGSICSIFLSRYPKKNYAMSPQVIVRLIKVVDDARSQLATQMKAGTFVESFHEGSDLTTVIHRGLLERIERSEILPEVLKTFRIMIDLNRRLLSQVTDVTVLGEAASHQTIQNCIARDIGDLTACRPRFINWADQSEISVLGTALNHSIVSEVRIRRSLSILHHPFLLSAVKILSTQKRLSLFSLELGTSQSQSH